MIALFQMWIKALWKVWWALMSSAIFTILSVYIAIANKTGSWLLRVTIVLAVIFFVIAAFQAWREQYVRAEEEKLKNGKPEIKGEASAFQVGMKGPTQANGKLITGAECVFKIVACNHRQVETSLRSVVLDGTLLSPPVTFSQPLEPGMPGAGLITFKFGIHNTMFFRCHATIEGPGTDIKLDNLKVGITDGLGLYHTINTKIGEYLRLSS